VGRTHIAKQRQKITTFKEMQIQCRLLIWVGISNFTIHETITLLQDFNARIYTNILYQVL